MRYEELKQRNAKTVAALGTNLNGTIGLIQWVTQDFVKTLNFNEVDQLYQVTDSDVVLRSLKLRYETFFGPQFTSRAKHFTQSPIVDEVVDAFADVGLELLVQGLMGFRTNSPSYQLSSFKLRNAAYEVSGAFVGIELEHDEQRNAEFADLHRQERFERVEPLFVPENNLAPAEKARRVRNGVTILNEVGWLNSHQHYQDDLVRCSRKALRQLEGFFKSHPERSAAEILYVADACAARVWQEERAEPGEFDDLWWERRGCSISFIVTHFDEMWRKFGN